MIIIILLIILSIVFWYLTMKLVDIDNPFLIVSIILALLFAISSLAAIGIMTINHIGYITGSDEASLQQEYKILNYEIDHVNDLYGDSVTLDKKALMNNIKEWNTKIASYQKLHESIFTNWIWPLDYSQFNLIEVGN